MEHLSRFAPLAARYDGFIIDLWGVLHDGVTAYAGAVDCLEHLRASGKRTVLLSNAPRRSEMARVGMRAMGISDDLYTDILTSGEATRIALITPPDAWFAALGRNVLHIGPARDRNVIDGLDLAVVDDPVEADFVLNTGPDDHQSPTDVSAFDGILSRCAALKLPMICANPDLEVIRGGERVICAGALAVRYEEFGGQVRSIGKPDPAIYRPVLRTLDAAAPTVLAVGDSLRTDIAGAAAAGIASAWILGGIHGADLLDDAQRARELVERAGLAPVACLPYLRW